MRQTPKSVADRLVSDGRPAKVEGRHVNLPVELGSTMVFDSMAAFRAAREARYETGTLFYGRYGNSAVHALEKAIAGLEGADGAVLTSSGVSAITGTLLSFLKTGDHLLVADNIYGNTRAFCDSMLRAFGVSVEYFDSGIGGAVKDLFRPQTRGVMFEAPGTGTFETPDIPAIAAACRDAGVVSVLDATWPSPVFCTPLALGVDIVVSSGSKHLSGHSDAMIGTVVANQPHLATVRKSVMALGEKPGAQEVFLSLRGLRTLKLRMEHVDRAGREMAAWIARHPQTRKVLHPAFEGTPGHANWARDFTGAAGLFGVLFDAASPRSVDRFVEALTHFGIGVSWGGYESLALPVVPVRTVTPWTEPGYLVRFNIGFEDLETLKSDLAQALPLLDS